MPNPSVDALLLVSFGGPEGPDDVLPFLDNVLVGRNVPQARKLAVAEHYYRFGGVSPLNQQNRELIAAIEQEFQQQQIGLPVYWGNRNWHPMLADTLRQMSADGIRHALALVTSPFRSYSGCRQYLEAIEAARQQVGGAAPEVSKLRAFCNHPRFVEAWCDRARAGLSRFAGTTDDIHVLFSAHSIPVSMAQTAPYVEQLMDLGELVAQRLGIAGDRWQLVYQSRSGPPQQPWLEPDVRDALSQLAAAGEKRVLLIPLGFLSDHIEVLFDLDVEAVQAAAELGIELVRAPTVGTHPQYVAMICDLVRERTEDMSSRPALGQLGPAPDHCPGDCCQAPRRP